MTKRIEDIEKLKTHSETLENKNTDLKLELKDRTEEADLLMAHFETEENKHKDLEKENESIKLDLKLRRKKLKQYNVLGRALAKLETDFQGLRNFDETDSDESSLASDEPQSKKSRILHTNFQFSRSLSYPF